MDRIRRFLIVALRDFGGLVLFLVVQWWFGLKPAIAVMLAFVVADGIRRLVLRQRPPKIYIFTNAMALIFGVIDLRAQTPFMIRYEAIVTNLITAALFAWSAFGKRSMIQEFAEQRQSAPFPPERNDIRAFFRGFTLMWAGYFVLKAAFYLWLMSVMPLKQALVVRSIVGSASFAILLGLSIRFGRQGYLLCVRLGWLHPPPGAMPLGAGAADAA